MRLHRALPANIDATETAWAARMWIYGLPRVVPREKAPGDLSSWTSFERTIARESRSLGTGCGRLHVSGAPPPLATRLGDACETAGRANVWQLKCAPWRYLSGDGQGPQFKHTLGPNPRCTAKAWGADVIGMNQYAES